MLVLVYLEGVDKAVAREVPNFDEMVKFLEEFGLDRLEKVIVADFKSRP